MVRFLCAIIIVVSFFYSCHDSEYARVKLDLYGLILPGKTISSDNVVAKYIWQGGG